MKTKDLYILRHAGKTYITTDIVALSARALALGAVGSADIVGSVRGSFAIPLQEIKENALEVALPPLAISYKCPRCKWTGSESELTVITSDGEKAIDHADGSPIMGCPKCGEHKLKEI